MQDGINKEPSLFGLDASNQKNTSEAV